MLRRRSRPVEKAFWQPVGSQRFRGLKFARQKPFLVDTDGKETFSVADFNCVNRKFPVEIDGHVHDSAMNQDVMRSAILRGEGMKVIRNRSDDVFRNPSGVFKELESHPRSEEGARKGRECSSRMRHQELGGGRIAWRCISEFQPLAIWISDHPSVHCSLILHFPEPILGIFPP
jgi:very-short-patch-repair endonuclease